MTTEVPPAGGETDAELGSVIPTEPAVRWAVGALVELVQQHLPQRFYRGEGPDRIYTAAMIVRMADTVEAMMALMDANLPVDGLILLRSLYEQVVVFCWLAIDFDAHIPRWLSGARWHDLRLHNDALPYDVEVLNPDELEASADAARFPDIAQLAAEVDMHWGDRIIGFRPGAKGRQGILNFRGMYVAIYRIASRAMHAQVQALDPYGDFLAYPVVVRRSERADISLWWPMAVPLYAQALLVCSEVLRWPDPELIRTINNRMYEQKR